MINRLNSFPHVATNLLLLLLDWGKDQIVDQRLAGGVNPVFLHSGKLVEFCDALVDQILEGLGSTWFELSLPALHCHSL